MIHDDNQLDIYSPIPFLIKLFCNDSPCGSATGFIYKYSDEFYLITNWHVLSGRDAITKKPMDKEKSALPDSIVIYPSIHIKNEQGDFIGRIQKTIKLKENDDFLWYEHTTFANKIDVAAIKIEPMNYVIVNNFTNENSNNILRIAQDVFILGYPLPDIEMHGFPIWKRGSIASPPMFDIGGLPKYMIDSATRKGMSGSPVFTVFHHVGFKKQDGTFTNIPDSSSLFGVIPHFEFLGVYSGRIGSDDENKIQLGNVWRKNVIEEIILGKKVYVEMDHLIPTT